MPEALSTIIFLAPLYIMGRAHPAWSLWPMPYFFFREIFLAKLSDCNLYRLTNNLTPDPTAN